MLDDLRSEREKLRGDRQEPMQTEAYRHGVMAGMALAIQRVQDEIDDADE